MTVWSVNFPSLALSTCKLCHLKRKLTKRILVMSEWPEEVLFFFKVAFYSCLHWCQRSRFLIFNVVPYGVCISYAVRLIRVDRTKSNSVQPKCSIWHFYRNSFYIKKNIFTMYHFVYRLTLTLTLHIPSTDSTYYICGGESKVNRVKQ